MENIIRSQETPVFLAAALPDFGNMLTIQAARVHSLANPELSKRMGDTLGSTPITSDPSPLTGTSKDYFTTSRPSTMTLTKQRPLVPSLTLLTCTESNGHGFLIRHDIRDYTELQATRGISMSTIKGPFRRLMLTITHIKTCCRRKVLSGSSFFGVKGLGSLGVAFVIPSPNIIKPPPRPLSNKKGMVQRCSIILSCSQSMIMYQNSVWGFLWGGKMHAKDRGPEL